MSARLKPPLSLKRRCDNNYVCIFVKNNSFVALARFDLNKTWWELMIGVTVPGILFAVSFLTLLIINQTVKVGDDARMTCQWCTDDVTASEPFVKPPRQQEPDKHYRKPMTLLRDGDETQELSVIEALVARSADIVVCRPPAPPQPPVDSSSQDVLQ